MLPARKAWVVDADSLTFREIYERAGRLAVALGRSGIRASDVVAFQLPNSLEALLIHLAVVWVGGVSLPLAAGLGRRELEHALADSCARLLIVPAEGEPVAMARKIAAGRSLRVSTTGSGPGSIERLTVATESLNPVDPKHGLDPTVLIYTSGTTSKPKGVLHSARSLLVDAESIVRGDQIGLDEVLFVPSSISHIAGVIFLLGVPFIQGNTVCTVQKWDVEAAIRLMRRERCTWATGAPAFLQAIVGAMVASPEVQLRLRVFRCGGADVPPALIRAARSLGIQAYRCYGCSEFPTITGCAADPGSKASDTDGRVHRHVSLRILDPMSGSRDVPCGTPGEIVVKGPEIFMGYTDAVATAAAVDSDGWLHTGDLGVLDEEGFLRIVGRIKDLIIRKGENISPREVEEVISAHEAVLDVAVVGVPDTERGQLACAFVVLRPGASLDLPGLKRHLDNAGLARFKWPERIESIDVLPRTASGKVRKEELRARAIGAVAEEQGDL